MGEVGGRMGGINDSVKCKKGSYRWLQYTIFNAP